MKTWLGKLFGGREHNSPADADKTVPSPPTPPDQTVLASAPELPSGAPEPKVSTEWRVGDVILDRYEVKHIYEGGGMGLVYRVHHRGWNMDLAMKSPRPEFFQSEAQKENFTRECETWI